MTFFDNFKRKIYLQFIEYSCILMTNLEMPSNVYITANLVDRYYLSFK